VAGGGAREDPHHAAMKIRPPSTRTGHSSKSSRLTLEMPKRRTRRKREEGEEGEGWVRWRARLPRCLPPCCSSGLQPAAPAAAEVPLGFAGRRWVREGRAARVARLDDAGVNEDNFSLCFIKVVFVYRLIYNMCWFISPKVNGLPNNPNYIS